MSLSDDKKALLAKLEQLDRDRAVTIRHIEILEDAARQMAELTHGAPVSAKLRTMEHTEPARGGRPIESKHPFVKRAVEMGLTVKAAANLLDVHPSTLRSWYVDGKEARDIPDAMVERLSEAPWSVPKTAWKHRK